MDCAEIKKGLKAVGKKQNYLAMKFNRPKSQISMAIRGKKYPTLKKKIIRHIKLLRGRL